MTSKPYPPPPFKDMYAWNFFLTRELEECTNSLTNFGWILPVVHGAFIQRKLHDYGRSLNLMLLARRSRHFAGTRYLKRGVSDRGKVANDVEHEQIIHDETTTEGVFSSYLQIRGSIPTFWTQESSVTMPKPPIVLNRVDPTYQATQAHFDDLLRRYGSPIIVVDLVKQSEKREREVIVGNEFRNAIDYINCHIDDQHKILYCALDYSHISKHRNLNVSSSLNGKFLEMHKFAFMSSSVHSWLFRSLLFHQMWRRGLSIRLVSSAAILSGRLLRAEVLSHLMKTTTSIYQSAWAYRSSLWSKLEFCGLIVLTA